MNVTFRAPDGIGMCGKMQITVKKELNMPVIEKTDICLSKLNGAKTSAK